MEIWQGGVRGRLEHAGSESAAGAWHAAVDGVTRCMQVPNEKYVMSGPLRMAKYYLHVCLCAIRGQPLEALEITRRAL